MTHPTKSDHWPLAVSYQGVGCFHGYNHPHGYQDSGIYIKTRTVPNLDFLYEILFYHTLRNKIRLGNVLSNS